MRKGRESVGGREGRRWKEEGRREKLDLRRWTKRGGMEEWNWRDRRRA